MVEQKSKRRVALFPASFDPITNGHLDLIQRSRSLFDEVVLAVAKNVSKNATFGADERFEILQAVTARRSLRLQATPSLPRRLWKK